MDTSMLITRRRLMQTGLGACAMAAASPLLAATPGVTPAQIEGPFFPTRDQADKDVDLTHVEGHSARALGEVIEVAGQVLDPEGAPLAGALVDVWQANHHGRYAHEKDPNPAPLDPDFQGWARITTDAEGRWSIRTIKPGAYPVNPGWSRPPHIHFKVALRGYRELITQMYFAGEPLNEVDRLLLEVPEDQRARLVVAFTTAAPAAPARGTFNIVLQPV
jgi:protocatechuate 3,4-dioxygenase, beta subunit